MSYPKLIKANYNLNYKINDGSYLYHNEHMPVRIFADGTEHWFLNDIKYNSPKDMPLSLFFAYCKWEYNKHGK